MKHTKTLQTILATLILVVSFSSTAQANSAETIVCSCHNVCDHPNAPLCEMTITGARPCEARLAHIREHHGL